MTDQELTGLVAMAGIGIGVVLIFSLIYWIIQIIAGWQIFKKAGEPGWKSIIPVYNTYTTYKIAWKPMYFWITLAISFVSGILSAMSGSVIVTILSFIVSIAAIVIAVMFNHKLSKAFGHGVGFTIGLIFLHPIFMLILGFEKSEYQGADL